MPKNTYQTVEKPFFSQISLSEVKSQFPANQSPEVIGEDGREVYSTLRDWAHDGDDRRILPVLRKFAEYCQPRKNGPFEIYKFNKRTQESGETYKTTLRKLSEACEFDTITPNEILRDRLIFGIHDTKVRERLLRENNLTLIKTDEICLRA